MSSALPNTAEAPGKGQSSLALPARKDEWLKDALASLSVANLCFLYVWGQVGNLAAEPSIRYYETQAPELSYVAAVIFDVFVLAAFIFALITLFRRAQMKTVRCTASVVLGLIALYGLYDLSRSLQPFLARVFTSHQERALKLILLLAALLGAMKLKGRALRLARNGFLSFSPLFFVIAAHAIWVYSTNDLRTAARGPAAGMLPQASRTGRLIWIIFDELDNRVLFEKRPARLHTPEFDRLRNQSVFAGHVKTPGKETLEAIPGMFVGKIITETKLDTNRLLIKTANTSEWVNFASESNVFRSARQQGFNTALAGWHHPYCRLIGNDLSQCVWGEGGWADLFVQWRLRQLSLPRQAFYLARWQSRILPRMEPPYILAPDGLRIYRKRNIALISSIWEEARRMLHNPQLHFVLLHFPIPHPPGIWDSQHDRLTAGNSNYIDNLELTDRVLGQIREELEHMGAWDRSTLLVSSDHPYRPDWWLRFYDIRNQEEVTEIGMQRQPYVPFLLKLPGQQKGTTYDREFNNVVSADLILQVLNGQISTPAQAVSWLNHNAKTS